MAAAARPAAIWLWPAGPTRPVIVVRLPSIQRMTRQAKQPPAALPIGTHGEEGLSDVCFPRAAVILWTDDTPPRPSAEMTANGAPALAPRGSPIPTEPHPDRPGPLTRSQVGELAAGEEEDAEREPAHA
jgi:hypothetical protein